LVVRDAEHFCRVEVQVPAGIQVHAVAKAEGGQAVRDIRTRCVGTRRGRGGLSSVGIRSDDTSVGEGSCTGAYASVDIHPDVALANLQFRHKRLEGHRFKRSPIVFENGRTSSEQNDGKKNQGFFHSTFLYDISGGLFHSSIRFWPTTLF